MIDSTNLKLPYFGMLIRGDVLLCEETVKLAKAKFSEALKSKEVLTQYVALQGLRDELQKSAEACAITTVTKFMNCVGCYKYQAFGKFDGLIPSDLVHWVVYVFVQREGI